jgi:hypothetical protein
LIAETEKRGRPKHLPFPRCAGPPSRAPQSARTLKVQR